jgi:hypothetical protein
MTSTWGPVEHVVGHNDDESGTVQSPHNVHSENYNATDGRHNKADHQGWPSVDGNSGTDVGEDGAAHGRFPDGPGPWRQT